MNTLLIRADATTEIGTGHVMRCLALAQGWHEQGGKVLFFGHCESDSLRFRIALEGVALIPMETPYYDHRDVEQTLNILEQLETQNPKYKTWLAIDGYHFDAQYQRSIKEAGYRLLWIDDYGHADHYYADIVLNQNISADSRWYINRETCTCLLLGTQYVLLRREFRSWQGMKRKIPVIANKILVTMGGSDSFNTTFKVIQALQKMKKQDLEVVAIIGPVNPYKSHIEKEIARLPFAVHCLSSVRNMAEHMAWADIAISAGGSTSWELAFMGLPSLIIINSNDQQSIASGLHKAGAAINLGWQHKVTPEKITKTLQDLIINGKSRRQMCKVGQNLVDGLGVKRLMQVCKGAT